MKKNTHKFHGLFLYFLEPAAEIRYREYVMGRAVIFTRLTWWIVILLAAVFSVMDNYFFGNNAGLVLKLRIGLVLLAGMMIFISHNDKFKHFMDWNGFIFVFFLSLFCNILIILDTTEGFSLWFASLFFVFPGVFCTAGLGFRYSFFAMGIIPIIFNAMVLVNGSALLNDLLYYNIFLGGMLLIYTFLAYLVENILRKNYIAMEQLKISMDEVRQLSGLLPICAKCKKIRNDEGYWQQVETYIQAHTKATFSHGLCPACLDDTYGDQEWYRKRKAQKTL